MKPNSYPLSPSSVWDIFYDITRCPRPSRNEKAIIEYIINIAKKYDCKYFIDDVSNILIKLPGTKNKEHESPILIQNHIDMVCDKLPEVKHNFHSDPIPLKVEGDWLTTLGTTLGADNGIGVAAALALITEKNLVHPPLELLFTTDEETGLNGALNLDTSNITSEKFINLDSEMWGELTVGCAGGKEVLLTKNLETTTPKTNTVYHALVISGLRGGHSGVDIHLQQGNANIILADFLSRCDEKKVALTTFSGGKAHNIISRTATAKILVDHDYIDTLTTKLNNFIKETQKSLNEEDKLVANISEELKPSSLMPLTDNALVEFCGNVLSIPHGAHKYDHESPTKLVRLSSNLAIITLSEGKMKTLSSYRFMNKDDQFNFEHKYKVISKQNKMMLVIDEGYPNWKPEYDGKLLALTKKVYQKEFNIDPIVSAMHAGLECGIVSKKIGRKMDIISFGPTILGAHTPKERVHIESVSKFWTLLKSVLNQI
jgi:dipeptidase D